ncbi:MAG: asparagine synthase [Bacteroidales bacterium]|nr:asparagine synthase [Bacteroidales bacterium]
MKSIQYNGSLYSPPQYTTGDGIWFKSFNEAAINSKKLLSWDLPTFISMISMYYPLGDTTLITEIKKNPWMSAVTEKGIELFDLPPHGFRFAKANVIADHFFNLLIEELAFACQGYSTGYLLLSGGLDSRIIACALREGINQGQIKTEITALTWGKKDSRDVRIAEMVSSELGFKWKNIELQPSTVLKNIDLAVWKLGCITNGYHLHGMSWVVENIPADSLIIAGSFGDGIGRAEYSGSHILELSSLRPFNRFGLIKDEYVSFLHNQSVVPLSDLGKRFPWTYKYEIAEIERQSQYMRNLIAHAMSILDQNSNLHQAFTSRKVFSYMWSIHPSLRNDGIYRRILDTYNGNIAGIPWARTNRSLSGNTGHVDPELSRSFNNYREWIATILYDQLFAMLDFDLFRHVKVLNIDNVYRLGKIVKEGTNGYHASNAFLWLIGLSRFNAMLKELGIEVMVPEIQPARFRSVNKSKRSRYFLSSLLRNNMYFLTREKKLYKRCRKKFLIWLFLLKHPFKTERNS